MWVWFSWLSVQSNGKLLWTRRRTLGRHKSRLFLDRLSENGWQFFHGRLYNVEPFTECKNMMAKDCFWFTDHNLYIWRWCHNVTLRVLQRLLGPYQVQTLCVAEMNGKAIMTAIPLARLSCTEVRTSKNRVGIGPGYERAGVILRPQSKYQKSQQH